MRILIIIAFRNLVQARRRTALLALAIAMVTALLVTLMALSRGIHDNLVESATTMSAGHVNVAGFYKPTSGSVSPYMTHANEVKAVVVANTPGLDTIVDRHRGWGKVIGPEGSVQVGLSGIVAEDEDRLFERLQLARECEYKPAVSPDGGPGCRDEIIGDPRDLATPGTMVLFASQAKRLGVGVGDAVTISTEIGTGQTNTADATVVAVGRDLGLLSNFAVFVPKSLILDLYQLNPDTTGAFWIYLDDIDDADRVMTHLRGALTDAGYRLRDHEANPFYFKLEAVQGEDWTGQKLDLTTWDDEVSFLSWIITGFDTLSWFLINILGVIIAVGIMNAMWTSVRERTREIGTVRAIGMHRGRVLALFLTEAFLLGLMATSAGASAGALFSLGIDLAHLPVPTDGMRAVLLSDTVHLSIGLVSIVMAVSFLTLLTTVSALWPAIRAASLRPVRALQHAE